jgi:hypothetical protein
MLGKTNVKENDKTVEQDAYLSLHKKDAYLLPHQLIPHKYYL